MTTTFDWSQVAPAWEQHSGSAARRGVEAAKSAVLLDKLAIAPGEDVLELGAGAGDLGLQLADLVGPHGTLLLSDVATGMVEILERRALGLDNVTVAQIDATDTGLPAASFDAVVFCMGLMFTLQPASVTQELRRVLKPGGRVGIETWAAPEHNPWVVSVGMAAMMNGLIAGGPPTQPGGLFSLSDPAALSDVITAGGFGDIDVTPVEVEFRYADFDDYFDTVASLAGPLAAALAAASPDQVQAVRATAAQLTEQYTSSEGLVLPGRALIAVASAG